MSTAMRHCTWRSASQICGRVPSGANAAAMRRAVIVARLLLVALVGACALPRAAWAVTKEWDGSSSLDFNTAANWTPSGVPTTDDAAFIRVLGANVTMSGGVGVADLTVSGGSKLSTSGQLLFVNSSITLNEDAGTVSLTVNPGPLGLDLDTDFLTVGANAELIMAGGVAQIDSRLGMSTTGTIRGFGVIEMTTSSLPPEIQNDGLLDTSGGTLTIGRGIPASIMTVDLDGQSDTGTVTVTNGTSSLVINAPLKDAINGAITVGDGNTITFNEGWTLGNAAAPAAKGTLTLTGGAAGPATVAGTASTISGNVNTTAGIGTFTSSVAFTPSAAVTVSAGATLSLAGATTFDGGAYTGSGQISQDANATIATSTTIGTGIYDMDGTGASQVTIAKDATLNLNVQTLDDADNLFEGTLSLNGGILNVNVLANQWTMAGTLNLIETGGVPGQVLGEKMQVQGAMNVSRTGRITSAVDFLSGTNVHLNGDDSRLELMGATSFAGGTYTGSGTLQTNAAVTIAGNTTVAAGVFDLDGAGETTTTTINAAAKLTINVGSFESGGGDTVNGVVTLNGGDLDVSVADGTWTMAAALNLTQNAAAIPQITGDSMETLGLITATGIAEIQAPLVQSGGGIQLANSASNLRLSNASLRSSVTGPGTLTLNGPTTVPLSLAVNCTTFDWDGDTENSTTTIATGAFLTVGAAQLEDDGGGYDGTTIIGDAARLRFLTAAVWSINTGTLRLQGTAEFSGTADITVTSASGKIEGTGVIAADVTTAGKTSPGLSAGVLHVAGNFTQQATGLLQIELGGTAFAAYDHLEVFQTATLAGTLDVDLIGGFMPSAGDEFTVLSFNSRVGDFTTYTGLNLGGGLTLMPVFSATSLTLIAMASSLQGDANTDGKVNIFDINVVSANWGTAGPTGDVNGDHMVNIFDINLISANWSPTGGATAVPEPTALVLAGLALVGLICRTHHGRRRG